MSNPLKAVGKFFKKVTHSTIGKIVLGALAIGAIVLTAGAAIPAFGAALGMSGGIAATLGVSGTLGTILSGAVSMGAVGAVTGFIGSGGKLSGLAGGFLGGAIGGAALGGIAPGLMGTAGIFGNGLGGAASGVTQAAGGMSDLYGGGLLGEIATGGVTTSSLGAAGAGLGATVPAAATASAGAGGGGLLSNPSLLMLGGQMLSGFSQGKAAEAEIEAQKEALKDKYDRTAFNYGYRNVYGEEGSDVPTGVEKWYDYTNPALAQPDFLTAYNAQRGGILGGAGYASGLVPTTYEIINGQVVPVRQPGG